MPDRNSSLIARRTFLAGGAATAGVLAITRLPGAAAVPIRRATGIREPFTLGVASGHPRHDGVVLWTRLAPQPLAPDGGMPPAEFTVDWEVAEDEQLSRVVRRGTAPARPELGHSVHIELGGLRPGREYWYRFRFGKHISETGRTKTLPRPGSAPDALRFAVACCQHYQTGYYTAYRSLADRRPDLVLFLGDYIYEYPWQEGSPFYLPQRRHTDPQVPVDLAGYRIRWSLYKSDPDLRRAHACAPFVSIWDDHEVLNDYAGLIPQPADTPNFAARRAHAYQAYYENLPVRRPNRSLDFGSLPIYQRLRIGDLATFHVLDTRQYRDDQPCDDGTQWGNLKVDDSCLERHDEDRTLLGVEQRDWLLDGLGRSSTRWDIVAQQALFAALDQNTDPAKGLWEVDSWDGYTADRRRVLETVRDTGNRSTVVLSGDIHNHLVADLRPDFLDESAPVVGTELVAGAISSSSFDDYNEFAPANSHLRFASESNGYLWIELRRDELHTEIRSMRDLIDGTWVGPDSVAFTEARYVVERGRPGAQPA